MSQVRDVIPVHTHLCTRKAIAVYRSTLHSAPVYTMQYLDFGKCLATTLSCECYVTQLNQLVAEWLTSCLIWRIELCMQYATSVVFMNVWVKTEVKQALKVPVHIWQTKYSYFGQDEVDRLVNVTQYTGTETLKINTMQIKKLTKYLNLNDPTSSETRQCLALYQVECRAPIDMLF
jgi:hypothetical protein